MELEGAEVRPVFRKDDQITAVPATPKRVSQSGKGANQIQLLSPATISTPTPNFKDRRETPGLGLAAVKSTSGQSRSASSFQPGEHFLQSTGRSTQYCRYNSGSLVFFSLPPPHHHPRKAEIPFKSVRDQGPGQVAEGDERLPACRSALPHRTHRRAPLEKFQWRLESPKARLPEGHVKAGRAGLPRLACSWPPLQALRPPHPPSTKAGRRVQTSPRSARIKPRTPGCRDDGDGQCWGVGRCCPSSPGEVVGVPSWPTRLP